MNNETLRRLFVEIIAIIVVVMMCSCLSPDQTPRPPSWESILEPIKIPSRYTPKKIEHVTKTFKNYVESMRISSDVIQYGWKKMEQELKRCRDGWERCQERVRELSAQITKLKMEG